MLKYKAKRANKAIRCQRLRLPNSLVLHAKQEGRLWPVLATTAWQPYACPCGYYGDALKACTCAPSMVTKYQKRISGPLLDRIDIHVEVPRVEYQKLTDDRFGESSEAIRQRVELARGRQRQRFSVINKTELMDNADMRVAEIRQFCKLDGLGESLVRAAMGQMNLSARGYQRVLKLARTIADLGGYDQIHAAHLAEALQYRPRAVT